ncbi:DUF357 domain-containing protein [Candidatus Woesearchaeota archaeon]|nr:DUF357 domain-containing protein [Candidatus Woesearchaeota archaeon]
MNTISPEKLNKYFKITKEAYSLAKKSKNRHANLQKEREDFLDMISRYITDAEHFEAKGEIVDAFAALNYAHGWLDAGARLGIFDVHDSRIFTVD